MTADDMIRLLQLTPLTFEGGYFRETYRSRWQVQSGSLPAGVRGPRSIGTAIYYLITAESFSPLHRLPGSEIFHFYLGDPVVMLQLHPNGEFETVTLGQNLYIGQQLQVVVRGGVWQGCRMLKDGEWALLGTTMSPGFDYSDYENGIRNDLISQFPAAEELIRQYTR
jgi:predicted cupin superfamily sugar epimerase